MKVISLLNVSQADDDNEHEREQEDYLKALVLVDSFICCLFSFEY